MLDAIYEFYEELLLNWSIIQQAMAPLRLTKWQMFKLFIAEIHRDNPVVVRLIATLLTIISLVTVFRLVQRQNGEKSRQSLMFSSFMEKREYFDRGQIEGGPSTHGLPGMVKIGRLQAIAFPPQLFDEIKRLDESQASAQGYFNTISHGFLGNETNSLLKTIAIDLTRSVPMKVHSQQNDAHAAMDKYLGYCPENKPIPLFDVLVKVLASMHISLLGGSTLGKSDWPEHVLRAVKSFQLITGWIDRLPQFLRPLANPILTLATYRTRMTMRAIVEPTIREDARSYVPNGTSKHNSASKNRERLPLTQWLLSRYETRPESESRISEDYIDLCIFSALKCASLLNSVISEIAIRPKLQEELCQEVNQVLINGELPSTHRKELRRMDSVLRETSRIHPFSKYTLCRKTRKTVQLSMGPAIPPGTIICIDAHEINQNYTNPKAFDPDRFYNKRSTEGSGHLHQFLSTGAKDPNWGDGIQACPGRFLANSSLKICLAQLLTNYTISSGQGDGRVSSRYDGGKEPQGLFWHEPRQKLFFQSKH